MNETLTVVGCLAASVIGGLLVVPLVLRLAGGGTTSAAAKQTLRGGLWIGLLERLAVTGSIAFGFSVGVGIVVAVKGLGRYPELKEHPEASERFVVGTLASIVWAGAWGLAARAVLR